MEILKYFNVSKVIFHFLPYIEFSFFKYEKIKIISFCFRFLFIECGLEFYFREDSQNDNE